MLFIFSQPGAATGDQHYHGSRPSQGGREAGMDPLSPKKQSLNIFSLKNSLPSILCMTGCEDKDRLFLFFIISLLNLSTVLHNMAIRVVSYNIVDC